MINIDDPKNKSKLFDASKIFIGDNGTQSKLLSDRNFLSGIQKKAEEQFPDDKEMQKKYFFKEIAKNSPAYYNYATKNNYTIAQFNDESNVDAFVSEVDNAVNSGKFYEWSDSARARPIDKGLKLSTVDRNNYTATALDPKRALPSDYPDVYRALNNPEGTKIMSMLGTYDSKRDKQSLLDGEDGYNHNVFYSVGKFYNDWFPPSQPNPVSEKVVDEPVVEETDIPPMNRIERQIPFEQVQVNIPSTPSYPETKSVPITPVPEKPKRDRIGYDSLFPYENAMGLMWNLTMGMQPTQTRGLETISNSGNPYASNALNLAGRASRIDYQEEPIQQMNTGVLNAIDRSGLTGNARMAALLNSSNQNRIARGQNRTQVDSTNAQFQQQANQQQGQMFANLGSREQQLNYQVDAQNNQYRQYKEQNEDRDLAAKQRYLDIAFTQDIPNTYNKWYDRTQDAKYYAMTNDLADRGYFNRYGNLNTNIGNDRPENDFYSERILDSNPYGFSFFRKPKK